MNHRFGNIVLCSFLCLAAGAAWAQGIGSDQLNGLGSQGVSGPTVLPSSSPSVPGVISASGQIQDSSVGASYGGIGPTGLSGYGPGTVTIYWTTSVASDSTVNYGLTSAYGSRTHDGSAVTAHHVVLTGLADDTDYHYSVTSSSSAGTTLPTPDAIFTSEGVTLISLIQPGSHVGFVNEDTFSTPNYLQSNSPADAVINAEFNSVTTSNDCKWQFTASADGSTNEFGPAGSGCYDSTIGRFPSFHYRLLEFMWFLRNPPSMVINAGNYLSKIAFRAGGTGGMCPSFGGCADLWSIDVFNEFFNSGAGPWSVGGPNVWEAPINALVAAGAPNYATTRMNMNLFGIENTSNWGGDIPPFPDKMAAQVNSKVYFDLALESMQNFIIAGGRIDGVGYETHLKNNYMVSDGDLKFQLWDLRRLGIIPEVSEADIELNQDPAGDPDGSPATIAYSVNYERRFLYDMMLYGGVTNFTFWNSQSLNGLPDWLAVFAGNQKTPLYYGVRDLLSRVVPSTSFPVVRRLGYYSSLPGAGVTSKVPMQCLQVGTNRSYDCGTQGLITIPWTEYVYRTNNGDGTYGAVTTFSQAKWTIDLQFYTLGNSNGNLFEAVDASSNPLVTVNRSSGGTVTVTIGGGSPVTVGTAATTTYYGLAITKNGTGWQFSLEGGAVATATGSIASIANLLWLDNSGTNDPTTDAPLATIDVYEAQSAVTDTAALQALSVFQNSKVLTFDQINGWTPP